MKEMDTIKWRMRIFFLLALLNGSIYAQSIGPHIINAAGSSAHIASNTFEWSVGEMIVVHTASPDDKVYTQGVLQPLFVGNVGVETPALSDFHLSAYPNPARNEVFLQPNLQPNAILKFVLYDMAGRVIIAPVAAQLLNGNEKQSIDVMMLAAGYYLLKVEVVEGRNIYTKVFKIQKQ